MGFFGGPGGEFIEDVAEIGEGLDAIEFAGLDEGVEGRCPFATGVIAGKEIILAADGHAPQGSFHGVVVDTESSFLKIQDQRRPTSQCIVDGLGNGTLGGHLHLHFGQPGMEGLQQGAGALSSDLGFSFRGVIFDLGLNLIELADAK